MTRSHVSDHMTPEMRRLLLRRAAKDLGVAPRALYAITARMATSHGVSTSGANRFSDAMLAVDAVAVYIMGWRRGCEGHPRTFDRASLDGWYASRVYAKRLAAYHNTFHFSAYRVGFHTAAGNAFRPDLDRNDLFEVIRFMPRRIKLQRIMPEGRWDQLFLFDPARLCLSMALLTLPAHERPELP